MSKICKIFGAPGTGKTTALIQLLEKELENSDLTLKDVVFVSFSNAAVNEVLNRVGVRKGQTAPFFRTLHGLALSCLIKDGKIPPNLLTKMHSHGFIDGLLADFCRELGIPFERGDYVGTSDALGNQAFSAWTAVIGQYYPRLRDLERCLEILYSLNFRFGEVVDHWLRYKEDSGIFDYNDLLIQAYEEKIQIDAEVGFFDEFQDFNRLEFELSKQIMSGLDRVYVAGDDDQAIYTWKGANPSFFLDLEGEERVLEKTYRLPPEVWRFAESIISKVKRRKNKPITPVSGKGVVQALPPARIEQLALLAAALAKQHPDLTVYLLFRTNRMVYAVEQTLLQHTIPFKRLKGAQIWDRELVILWNISAKLRQGKQLELKEIEFIITHANPAIIPDEIKENLLKAVRMGSIPIEFFEILKKTPIVDLVKIRRRRVRDLIQRAYQPIDFSRINLYVDTIHAAKGKEADIVVLGDGITSTIASTLNNGFEDAELRVYYVGASRARKWLIIAPISGFRQFLLREVLIPC